MHKDRQRQKLGSTDSCVEKSTYPSLHLHRTTKHRETRVDREVSVTTDFGCDPGRLKGTSSTFPAACPCLGEGRKRRRKRRREERKVHLLSLSYLREQQRKSRVTHCGRLCGAAGLQGRLSLDLLGLQQVLHTTFIRPSKLRAHQKTNKTQKGQEKEKGIFQ